MRHAKDNNYWMYNFFLILVLFLPTTNFFIFYGVMFCYTLLLFVSYPIKSKYLAVAFGIISWIVCVSLFRVAIFGNIEDLKEAIKVVIVCLLIMIPCRLNLIIVLNILFIFVCVNFIFSLFQYIHWDPNGLIAVFNHYYVAEHHIAYSLSYSTPRAVGFASGPGQQAVLNIFIASVFFVSLKWTKQNRKQYWIGIVLALMMVLMSQSKTIILSLPVGLVLFVFVSLRRITSTPMVLLIFFLLFIGLMTFFMADWLLLTVPELGRVVENGLAVSSFLSRLENWRIVTSPMSDGNLLVFLFGIGRSGLEYMGINKIPYDSDYVYFYVNFGIVGLLFFLFMLVYFLIIRLLTPKLTPRRELFSLLSSFSLIVALALNFYIEPRVYVLTVVLFACYNLMIERYEEQNTT